jgi:hypothetical protein
MRKFAFFSFAVVAAGIALASNLIYPKVEAQSQSRPGTGFAAVPGTKGGQDIFGPYEVVKGWPKDISTLPGNEKWTYGAGQSVFAESPNRVFMLFRGELPVVRRPQTRLLPGQVLYSP